MSSVQTTEKCMPLYTSGRPGPLRADANPASGAKRPLAASAIACGSPAAKAGTYNGVRTMPGYAYQVPVSDRWAIVSYVRALQRSQRAVLADVPESQRNNLK